ncbi:hypothetical protein [Pseudophaeobacter leonis]|uniref:hypothetical protein n=1 Tax=Pseudophaeobacter leonis TaxID=1144477 RepID=UPI0009F54032|nr:hypothetical protein [Pseudophaeobacter leonis]
MTEQSPQTEALLLALQDIRLPGDAPGGFWAEAAVAMALGVLVATGLAMVFAGLSQRRVRPAPAPQLSEQIAVARRLPEESRILALLHLARRHYPQVQLVPPQALYTPGQLPAAQEVEAVLLAQEAGDA